MKRKRMFLALALVISMGVLTLQPQDKPQEKPTGLNLRQELVKLQFVKAKEIQLLLYGFASPYGKFFWTENLPHVLTLTDFPANVDKMLAAIKEIDIKPCDLLFTVQLVLASENEEKNRF